MEALSVPFLPAGLWILSVAMTIVLLLVMFGFFIYQHNRKEALLKDGRDVAHLAAKRDLLQSQIAADVQWIQDQKAEMERLSAERNEQEILRNELGRLSQDCASKDEENQTLRNEVGALENQKHLLAQTLEKIERNKEKCSDEVQKLEARKYEVEKSLSKSDLMMSEKKEEVEQLKGQVESHQNTMTGLEKGIREQKTELGDIEYRHNALLEKVDKLQDMEHQFDLMKKQLIETKQGLDDTRHELAVQQRFEDEAARKAKEYRIEAEELGKKKIGIENRLEELKKALTKQEEQRDYAEYKLEQKENQLAEVKQEFKDTKDELAIQERLEGETAKKVYMLGKEVDRLKSEETALNSSIKSLEVLAKRLNKQLDGQGGDATAHENKYRDLWYPISFPDLSPVAGSPNEKQLLKKTADYIRGQKLYFPERVLYAFHTALKISDISPLVVLAGISGTGKSELPRRYAEGMGLHFVILPVQPRWDSPQDLFGFYNYLEGRYKATELARAMVQFELYNRDSWPLPEDWNHDRSDRMLLVLLDEMNLARVEYYFSEFLSRLETRRGINLA